MLNACAMYMHRPCVHHTSLFAVSKENEHKVFECKLLSVKVLHLMHM